MKIKRELSVLSAAMFLLLAGSCAVPLNLNRVPIEGGIVQPAPQQKVGKNKPIDISAIAADEHRFVNWTLTGGDAQIADANSATTSVSLRTAATVTANFERTFTLITNIAPAGGGAVNPTVQQNIIASMPVNISATAADGFRFVNWTVMSGAATFANANSANTTVTLGENATVTANFQRVVALTLNATPAVGGSATSTGGALVPVNTPTNIVATPSNGFRFAGWTVADGQAQIANPASANTTVSIAENATVTANFRLMPGAQFNPNVTYGELTDSRDNKRYRTVEIGDLVWMAENLNHETRGSYCYNNDSENCEMYGRLYDWASASGACPANWRLPDTSDWNNLNANTNDAIRARAGWDNFTRAADDRFGFSALPSGIRGENGTFARRGTGAAWWSGSDAGNQAVAVRLGVNNDSLSRGSFGKNNGMAVRCVRDLVRVRSITILAPQSVGLTAEQGYLPTLVQGEFVSNISTHSNISVLDWERLDEIYANLFSDFYDDNARANTDLGRLTHTSHIMGGTITKTTTGYVLQMHVTNTSTKRTVAAHSEAFTFEELDNLTGIRRASLQLLGKMGIDVTPAMQEELTRAAPENHVNAQTALAHGITAQRQGTEVAALSYFFRAAAYDPSFLEAIKRSSVLSANISTGNIGDDVRNDIAWRNRWVERLKETEEFFDNFNRNERNARPYTLSYSNNIRRDGRVDYSRGTINLTFDTWFEGTNSWVQPIVNAVKAVHEGLWATERAETWGLNQWPGNGVTERNPFYQYGGGWRDEFNVVFELVNSQNRVIARQTLGVYGNWSLRVDWNSRNRQWEYSGFFGVHRNVIGLCWGNDCYKTQIAMDVTFQDVNANDITDQMTIRVATINDVDAATAVRTGNLQVIARD